ncbi:beta-microseminoprotein-like [Dreissena polymorpha]|uniref:beta-microseminoprotein-like n=1 Tax=Dreissena polymorpha TaxID=45954 RepID=UPI0022640F38|nr:beta-microseminoprotein-like [Dreissena polymorpha]
MDARSLLVLMCIVQTASGALWGEVVHGKVVKFCKHKGIRLLPTSTFIDYHDCSRCECSDDGLSCQSVGLTVKAVGETKCSNVTIACKDTWVLKADTTKKCPTHLMPKAMTAVGK